MTSQSTPPASAPATTSHPGAAPSTSAWPAVVALAAGIAVLVASEFLPASVLLPLAAELGVSEGTAGLAVASTAIAGAITAPSIAVVLPRMDRRRALIGLLVVALVSNLAVALAPSFAVLLIGRLILGIAIAGYWSFAFGAGTHAMPGRPHVVSSALAFGVGIATIVAVPLGSLISDVVGWRVVFAGAAGVTAVAVVAVALTVPSVPAHPSAGFRMLREAVSNPRLMGGIGCVVLVAFGNFAAYPYIRIAIDRVAPDGETHRDHRRQ